MKIIEYFIMKILYVFDCELKQSRKEYKVLKKYYFKVICDKCKDIRQERSVCEKCRL